MLSDVGSDGERRLLDSIAGHLRGHHLADVLVGHNLMDGLGVGADSDGLDLLDGLVLEGLGLDLDGLDLLDLDLSEFGHLYALGHKLLDGLDGHGLDGYLLHGLDLRLLDGLRHVLLANT